MSWQQIYGKVAAATALFGQPRRQGVCTFDTNLDGRGEYPQEQMRSVYVALRGKGHSKSHSGLASGGGGEHPGHASGPSGAVRANCINSSGQRSCGPSPMELPQLKLGRVAVSQWRNWAKASWSRQKTSMSTTLQKARMPPRAAMLQGAAKPRAKANALARRWTPLKRPVKRARERWTQLKMVQMAMVLEVELRARAQRTPQEPQG